MRRPHTGTRLAGSHSSRRIHASPASTQNAWANELGARLGDLKQHRVEAKAAVFYQIVWDYQVERLAVFPDVTIFNAPEVRSCGFEAELKAELLAGWTVQAAAGYTHSEFERFSDPLTDVNYAGRRTPFTPEFTVGVSTRYKARLGIFGEVGITAAGETFYDEANTAFLRQAPYAELNARVGNGTERFSLAVYGENLNDARYFTQKIGYASIGAPAAPRRFGGSVSVKF